MLAALTGYLLGAVLLAVGLSMGLTGLWAPALLLGHGGLLLWGWAMVLQAPAED
ncbi:MAG: hypothetical protein ACJ762_08585 [Solirubrobacteraceae bacterium]